jgi:fatty acid desaturase
LLTHCLFLLQMHDFFRKCENVHTRATAGRAGRKTRYHPLMRPEAGSRLTAGDVLTLSELRYLERVSGLRSATLVAHAWGIVTAAMIVHVLWPSTVTLVAAFVVIGARQFGLTVLVHEAVHWRLFRHAKVNDQVALWLCAFPVGAVELPRYRKRHHQHHRHTRQPEDPDLALSDPFPVTRATLCWSIARDLVGITAGARLFAAWRQTGDVSRTWRQVKGPLLANLVLLGVLTALGQWHLYLLLWVLPLFTWYQLLTRIRDLAEHSLTPHTEDPLRNTRTVSAGFFTRFLVAPYWVNYHLEHHLFVFVPCWKLRAAHALLLAKGYGPQMEVAPSYTAVIRSVTAA